MFAIRHISANFYHQAMVQQVNYRVYHQSGTNNMFYESLSWLEEEFIYQVILSITLITKLTLRETWYVGQEFKEKSGRMTLNAISRAEFFTILQSFLKSKKVDFNMSLESA